MYDLQEMSMSRGLTFFAINNFNFLRIVAVMLPIHTNVPIIRKER